MTTVQPVRIRTDEFDRMTDIGLFDGRHIELLEGTLYEMPPMRTPHLLVLVRLQQLLAPMNAERRLLVQVPLQVPDFDEPEPDLAVLRAPLGRRKPTAADCQLVIEVSDSTLGFDRERKVPAYLRGGVPTVWIINVPDQQVEVYRADSRGHRVYLRDDRLEVDGVAVDLAALFEDLQDEAAG
jgi:Uma2 family endonuclease